MSRVQSIARAFTVLAALRDGPLGVTGVAERARLPKSTVARLLAALAAEGAVEQVVGGTDYRIGDRLVTLAAGVSQTRSLIALARPQLEWLAEVTGEAAGLSIEDGSLIHYVDHAQSSHPVGIRDWTGTRFPMHTVSAGLVILAHRRPDQVEQFLASDLERVTPRTEVDPDRLRSRIARARADGYAWTIDEAAVGISSCAAAVADESGEVIAAVHVHGPSYRFPDPADSQAADAIGALVVTAAANATASLRRAGS